MYSRNIIYSSDNIKTIIEKKAYLNVRSKQINVFLREYSKVKNKPLNKLISDIKNKNSEQDKFIEFVFKRTDIPI
jgi:hypothetical protein